MVSLREKYPEALFTWVTTPEAAALLKHDPWIERVITFDKNRSQRGLLSLWRKARELKSYNFDLAFGVQRSWRTSLLLALAGIKNRTGFSSSGLFFLYSKCMQPAEAASHAALKNLVLSEDTAARPLRIIPQRDQNTHGALDPARCVVLGVGSAWATKRWTVGGFIEVAKAVIERGFTPVLIGGAADQARADIVSESVPGCISLLLALDQSVSFVSACVAVVCHDSLLLHLSSAFKRPTVVIFCSTIPAFGFGPWQNPDSIIVETTGLSCKPCGRHGHSLCPTGTWACSLQVRPREVITALDCLLARGATAQI